MKFKTDFIKELLIQIDQLHTNSATNIITDEIKLYLEDIETELDCKQQALQTICDIGFDYDGESKSEDLKEVINTLVKYAKSGLHNEFPQYADSYGIYEFHSGIKIKIKESKYSEDSKKWMSTINKIKENKKSPIEKNLGLIKDLIVPDNYNITYLNNKGEYVWTSSDIDISLNLDWPGIKPPVKNAYPKSIGDKWYWYVKI
jgi:hypothetical protein